MKNNNFSKKIVFILIFLNLFFNINLYSSLKNKIFAACKGMVNSLAVAARGNPAYGPQLTEKFDIRTDCQGCLFRGDNRPPQIIFRDGFKAQS